MVIILGFYFFFEPLRKFVFMAMVKCCKKEKRKITKNQLWGKNGCCLCCCGKKNFGSIN
jgi:hypothetical protein